MSATCQMQPETTLWESWQGEREKTGFTYRVVQSATTGSAAALGIGPGPGSILSQAGAVDGALLARGDGARTGGLGSGGHHGREGEREGDDEPHCGQGWIYADGLGNWGESLMRRKR